MFLKIFNLTISYFIVFTIVIRLSSTSYLPHSGEMYSYNNNPFGGNPSLSRRSDILHNSIIVQNASQPREYNPISVKELFCKRNAIKKIETCEHGVYFNEYCQYEDCYRGIGESCDDNRVQLPINGKCAPNFYCICGECTGCENGFCRLELCRRNGFYDKRNSKNFF